MAQLCLWLLQRWVVPTVHAVVAHCQVLAHPAAAVAVAAVLVAHCLAHPAAAVAVTAVLVAHCLAHPAVAVAVAKEMATLRRLVAPLQASKHCEAVAAVLVAHCLAHPAVAVAPGHKMATLRRLVAPRGWLRSLPLSTSVQHLQCRLGIRVFENNPLVEALAHPKKLRLLAVCSSHQSA